MSDSNTIAKDVYVDNLANDLKELFDNYRFKMIDKETKLKVLASVLEQY